MQKARATVVTSLNCNRGLRQPLTTSLTHPPTSPQPRLVCNRGLRLASPQHSQSQRQRSSIPLTVRRRERRAGRLPVDFTFVTALLTMPFSRSHPTHRSPVTHPRSPPSPTHKDAGRRTRRLESSTIKMDARWGAGATDTTWSNVQTRLYSHLLAHPRASLLYDARAGTVPPRYRRSDFSPTYLQNAPRRVPLHRAQLPPTAMPRPTLSAHRARLARTSLCASRGRAPLF